MTSTNAAPTADAATDEPVAWHAVELAQVLALQEVDEHQGLTAAEAAARRERYGPNKLAEAPPEPRWKAFVRQYADPMQLVLLVAGIGSFYPIKQYGTAIVILGLTLLNALIGLRQEGKAAAAVAALQKMMFIKAKVRRDGEIAELPAHELVPGDIDECSADGQRRDG